MNSVTDVEELALREWSEALWKERPDIFTAAMVGILTRLLDEHSSQRAHIQKLCEIFDSAVPCSDKCDLCGILAWVDPADKERTRDLRDLLRDVVEAARRCRTRPDGAQLEDWNRLDDALDVVKE